MTYGYFDDKNKEYVITNPKTPVKWINYIGGLSFGGFIDQTGGSLICKGDPALNRIVKYMPQLPAASFNGETCYIRLKKADGYDIFSPFYVPTLHPYDRYECHVGMGYNRYISEYKNIRTEITVFVPQNEYRVIRDYKITNLGEQPIEIDMIPVVEYTHFDALKQYTNADWVPQTMQSECLNMDNGSRVLLQYAYMRKGKQVNFFTSNAPIASFETDRHRFVGKQGYGTFQTPGSLENDEFSNYLAIRGDQIAAIMQHLGVLKKHETKRIITQLGQTDDIKKEVVLIKQFNDEKNVDKAFEALKIYWQTLLKKQVVTTPNNEMNSMINVFNPRQCMATLNWSRYLSLYQLGLGARSMGVRDTLQDIMGAVLHDPSKAKALLQKVVQVQNHDGSMMHQFNPLTMVANHGDAREMDDRYQFYGDDHLWLVLAVCSYLKETGDMSFLDEALPYYDKNKLGKVLYKANIKDHLLRALSFSKEHVGKHGLPLLGFADWNDTVNLEKGAESLFNASLYGKALLEMIELMVECNDHEIKINLENDYELIKEKFNQYAWDGKWHIRYFDHLGQPIGSHLNDKGKIYTNAQSWPIIAGFVSKDKAIQSLDAVHTYLNTNKGIKLSYPSYDGYDEKIGGITSYPPGAKENGVIFLHTNPWVMIAETMVGHGKRAFDYYKQMNPASKNDVIEAYECEPYVYPQNILGDEHPQFGLARNSWLSGTASWTYQAATKYILGINPTYQGLEINPCIPASWKSFKVSRIYRNTTYHISVFNPKHVEKGVQKVVVENEEIKDHIIPIFNDGKTYDVKVIMG